ncbi:uncharacterized protein BX664DRAFT_320865 [Halteromyces radiatus]|uniref:uncharacterized protein n=1 Tax=Halteromyces radiatus TaxID=101107 RepID=UPI00221EFDE0|nr:uncharacterized protein BX664DRAFT_320865 [Halteromyces radiatus]KAI8099258.1 hypothetical protein BX664DRAFT_320865 [Halteromyces radiatus]
MYRLDLPQMNSYQRLMVHKVAPYFHLSHFFDPLRQSIFLCKNPHTDVPPASFIDLVSSPEEQQQSQQSTFKIMKRTPLSSQHQRRRQQQDSNQQDMSIEERKKGMTYEQRKMAYEEARARIFSDLEEQQTQQP